MHNQFKTQKFKHLMLAMGPRDLNSAPYSPAHCSSHLMTSFPSSELTELPVVENSQLFAQRAHSHGTAHGTPPLCVSRTPKRITRNNRLFFSVGVAISGRPLFDLFAHNWVAAFVLFSTVFPFPFPDLCIITISGCFWPFLHRCIFILFERLGDFWPDAFLFFSGRFGHFQPAAFLFFFQPPWPFSSGCSFIVFGHFGQSRAAPF